MLKIEPCRHCDGNHDGASTSIEHQSAKFDGDVITVYREFMCKACYASWHSKTVIQVEKYTVIEPLPKRCAVCDETIDDGVYRIDERHGEVFAVCDVCYGT
jgi:hypothetical protein